MMQKKRCKHVYEDTGKPACPHCGNSTHEIDWKKQNSMQEDWLKKNPDAWKKVGWWSI